MEILENAAQEKAISLINGHIMIVACPGSGKTTTLMRRIHNMILTGADPSRILTVTFTNAAADGMKEKYQKMFGQPSGSNFMTIHSLCFSILRTEGQYRIEDLLKEEEKQEYFFNVMKRIRDIADPWDAAKSVITEISAVKNNYIDLKNYEAESIDPDIFAKLFYNYKRWNEQNGKIDFDDMLIKTKQLFAENPSILRKWQDRFDYLQVDEYQDTNYIQKDIIYMLCERHGNLCVVGDDDQSIYRFRGARPEIMLSFTKDFPDAVVINMSINYRSAQKVVDKAGCLIKENKTRYEKDFISYRGMHKAEGDVIIIPCEGRAAEIKDVIKKIQEMHKGGTDYNDIAILFRTNALADLVMQSLSEKKIPFYSTEAVKCIYDHFIFQDMMSYARLSAGRGSSQDIMRVVNRPNRWLMAVNFKDAQFTKAGMLKAVSYLYDSENWKYEAAKKSILKWMRVLGPGVIKMNDKPSALFTAVFGNTGLQYGKFLVDYAKARNMDYSEVKDITDALRADSSKYATIGAWMAHAEDYRRHIREKDVSRNQKGVIVSTMHKSKGLEWPCVIIIDADEKIAPYKKSLGNTDAVEEERRLFYVSMTRAKDLLYIYYSTPNPSRFIKQMIREQFMPKPTKSVKPAPVQKKLAGTKVSHRDFGTGKIRAYKDNYVIINFDKGEVRFKFPDAFQQGHLKYV